MIGRNYRYYMQYLYDWLKCLILLGLRHKHFPYMQGTEHCIPAWK